MNHIYVILSSGGLITEKTTVLKYAEQLQISIELFPGLKNISDSSFSSYKTVVQN